MKKVIIALDGNHFPKGAFEFAKYLNNQSEILLAGIFLAPVDYSKLMAYSSGINSMAIIPEWITKNDDEEIINKNIQLFEDACIADGMHYRVHKDISIMALSSLEEESRFADLLLISGELFYKNIGSKQPNYYMEELLQKTECPVILVPENFTPPLQIIFNYDGSSHCMFAIKQFAYLFPEMTNKETTLLFITNNDKNKLPFYDMVSEFMAKHYPNLQLQNLVLEHKSLFVDWLEEQKNSFIIMGSFARGMYIELFKQNFVKKIIQKIKMPIFISHK